MTYMYLKFLKFTCKEIKEKVVNFYIFSTNRPLSRFFLVAVTFVLVYVCMSPSNAISFEASHWPSDDMISYRPVIGPHHVPVQP